MPIWGIFQRKVVPQRKDLEVRSLTPQGDEVAFSQETFGLALLQQETAAAPKQNIFVSPLSIFLALCMTQNGAAGNTKAAIRKVLGLRTDATDEALNQSAAKLFNSLQSSGDAELTIANALWVDIRSTVAPDFVRVCQEVYAATAETLDLNHPSSVMVINDWVSEKTRGKIPEIVTPNGVAGLPAILTNAIFLKGAFCNPFPKEATQPKPFYLTDGREKIVPMMRLAGLGGSYRRGKRFEAAVLRYKGSGIALYMLLPAKGIHPEQVLTEECVQEMLLGRARIELDLSIPRFALDFGNDLRESLSRLGMGIAFQMPGADFSALGTPPFYIGGVFHKTRLEVDEQGTVAAAATVVYDMWGLKSQESKTLVFDHPFAVLLRDTKSGAILFAGIVYEP
jgi:serine protease inhibitor